MATAPTEGSRHDEAVTLERGADGAAGASTRRLEVVIVSHGADELLSRCLDSLRRHRPRTAELRVTVIDSGSPDGTPDRVAAEYPEVRLIRRGNIGFSAANNLILREVIERRGAKKAGAGADGAADEVREVREARPDGSDDPGPFVLLLNPDTELFEGTLDSSLERLAKSPDVGMVGCKLVTEDGSLDHACKRTFPSPLSALAHFTGVGRRPGAPPALSGYRASHLGDDEASEVDAINGAYMMVRARALAQVGPLDEGYWLFMEDLDWCRRFWNAGWKVFYEPAGTALHVKGGSSPPRRHPRQEIAFHRGMGRFYRRFEAPDSPGAVNLAVYCGIGLKLLVSLAITFARFR